MYHFVRSVLKGFIFNKKLDIIILLFKHTIVIHFDREFNVFGGSVVCLAPSGTCSTYKVVLLWV